MPWIFLTLMLANIVYFGWSFINTSQAPARQLSVAVVQEGARIVLLNERTSSAPSPQASAVVTPSEEAPIVTESVAMAAQRFFVGPFHTSDAAKQFMSKMSRKGLQVRIDERKAEGKDYWVYIPPFTNRDKAEERLRELRARKVESFIVGEGSFTNAISLGHFSKKELAQSLRQKLTEAGVAVEYREMPIDSRVTWVYVAPEGASKVNSRQVVDAEMRQNDALRKESASCEE